MLAPPLPHQMRKRFRIWHLNAQNICAKIRQYIRKAYVMNMLKCCGFYDRKLLVPVAAKG